MMRHMKALRKLPGKVDSPQGDSTVYSRRETALHQGFCNM
jgi:hypothetical protein